MYASRLSKYTWKKLQDFLHFHEISAIVLFDDFLKRSVLILRTRGKIMFVGLWED